MPPPPIKLRREPCIATPGRLPLAVDEAVEAFREIYLAYDSGDLRRAVEPSRKLRLFGVSIKITPPSSPVSAKPSAPRGRGEFDRLFGEGAAQ